MNRLKGKVAIITVATDGISLAISHAFVNDGASRKKQINYSW